MGPGDDTLQPQPQQQQQQPQQQQQQQQQQEEIQINQAPVQEAPQQLQEPAQENAPGIELPQPELVHNDAPAPVMEEPVQQQEMGRKERRAAQKQRERALREERRAQEAERKAREKAEARRLKEEAAAEKARQKAEREAARQREKEAEAARKVLQQKDAAIARMLSATHPILQEMKRDPAFALHVEAARPTAPLLLEVEGLEQALLEQYQTSSIHEPVARELLQRIRVLRNAADAYDQHRQDLFLLQNHMQDYLAPRGIRLPQGSNIAITNYYPSRLNAQRSDLVQQIAELQTQIFSGMTAEERGQRMNSVRGVRTGEEIPAYQQVYAAEIQGGMTISQARAQYEEQILLARRPVTLKKLEERREAWRESQTFQSLLRDYAPLQTANGMIRDSDPQARSLGWNEANEITREYLEDAIRNSAFQIRVPNCEIMGLILDSGRFKTQMETNSSRALMNVDIRKAFSERCFGIDAKTLPPEDFEIYGYASHGDLVRESRSDSIINQGSCQYGHVVVTLRKERMLDRTTLTIGDSLSNQFATRMNFVYAPDLYAVGGLNRSEVIRAAYFHQKAKKDGREDPLDVERLLEDSAASYAELQYHGGVRLEDIESVTLMADAVQDPMADAPELPEQEMPPELLQRLREHGIRAYKVRDGEQHEL